MIGMDCEKESENSSLYLRHDDDDGIYIYTYIYNAMKFSYHDFRDKILHGLQYYSVIF